MEPLRIYLFGGLFLERAGVVLPPIASRAGRSLFAYLVMHRNRPVQRDLLAGMFFPEMSEGKARRRLSHTLWQIQDVVNVEGASHLIVTPDTLTFDGSSPYWLDAEEFDRSFEAHELTSARSSEVPRLDASALKHCLDLYRGDFMAGFFDDWVVVDQDHYRQRHLVLLRRLIDAAKANGDYEMALAYARRLTHHDPLSEETHREVMRMCFLLGRTGEAIQQFERCRSVLADELEAEPSRDTLELYERIVRHRRAGIVPTTTEGAPIRVVPGPEVPFVGRERERRNLVDYSERVLAGPGGVVLLEGEPGVGKTRLALEAAEDARWRGFEVSWGRCTPGAVRPYAPLVEVLESLSSLRAEQLHEQLPPLWLHEVTRLAPRLGTSGATSGELAPLRPTEESARMREALVNTLAALGEITPHLVIIDDVQWADKDTLGVIGQLGARLADSRILLLLLYRSEEARGDPEVWDMLREGDRVAGLGREILSPLSVFELEEMVKRTLGVTRLDPAVSSRLHRQTGGNALFSLETLRAFRDRGIFEAGDPGEALERQLAGPEVPVAPRVRSVIDSRTSLLSDEAAAVLELTAVCGAPVELDVIAGGTDLDRSVVLHAVGDLLHRGLIQDDEGRFDVAHDQVRQVVYDRINPTRRARLHRRVARSFDDAEPDNVEAIGYHYWQGGSLDLAASHLQKAGLRAVEVSAYATAEHHFQTARSASSAAGWDDAARYRLLGHLEDVLDVLGQRETQAEVLDEMAGLTGSLPQFHGDMERRRAWLSAHLAEFDEAEESARRSVLAERRSGDGSGLAASLVALGTCLRWAGRRLEALPFLEEAVSASEDDLQTGEALAELGSTLIEVQRADDAMPYLETAQAIYQQRGDLRGQAEVAGIQARALHEYGNRDLAVARYQSAIELCRRIGYRHGEGVNLVNLSLLNHMLGDVADSLAGYDTAAGIFAELGNRRGEAMVLANSAWARQSILGDYERAEADANQAMRHFIEIGDRAREAQCLEIIAGVEIARGHFDQGNRLLQQSLRALAGTGHGFLETQHLRSLALVQLELGQLDTALETIDRAERLCHEAELHDLAVELGSIRAMVELRMSRISTALASSRSSQARMTPGVERPYLIHHRHAQIAEAAGEIDEARQAALRANELLEGVLSGLSTEQRQTAIDQVPEHRAIIEAASRFSPSTIQVLIPSTAAPTGRRFDETDLLEVSWTIHHPSDYQVGSAIERRRIRVLRLLEEAEAAGASPSMQHLADVLGVSASTVRRDLEELRHMGHGVATRGQRKVS